MSLVKRAEFFQSETVSLYMPEKYGSVEIYGIEYDSRKVAVGSLFAAIEGFNSDGCEYISSALQAGASAILLHTSKLEDFKFIADENKAIFFTDDVRKALSQVSSKFFGEPSKKMDIIGITGTNGKTSITYMLESIFNNADRNCGVIGTVNYRWKGNLLEAPNTTPESRDLHELLYKMYCAGTDTVVMEVSSHALSLGRVDDIYFNVAVITNLTGDHLDFHQDMEDYFNAKSKLFDLLDKSPKTTRVGIVNADDDYCMRILGNHYSYPLYSFVLDATDNVADYSPKARSIENKITGLSYIIDSPKDEVKISLSIAGSFHVANSIVAFAVADCLGIKSSDICDGLSALKSIPGRFDIINSKLGFSVIVDYAHTPDALLKLLIAVNDIHRSHNSRIITVFGCGGDRDKTKRPVMGGVASENSDFVIVTSDNPRTEEPNSIINDILNGVDSSKSKIIPDRKEAICQAIKMAQPDDIIVIAGKGHEDYQILGKTKIKFDDHIIAREFIEEREVKEKV